MKIVTNWRAYPLCSWNDLPAKARAFFDYLDQDELWTDRFVQYRGEWYDVYDVQRIAVSPDFQSFGVSVTADSPLAQWDGVQSESYWTGVVFRFLRGDLRDTYGPDADGYVQIGRFGDE